MAGARRVGGHAVRPDRPVPRLCGRGAVRDSRVELGVPLAERGHRHNARPPLKAAGHHATINVATAAAAAAAAAVDHATRTGQGEHIDFSMYAAAAKLTEFAPAAASFLGVDASRLGTKTVVPWGIFECADGLVSIICPEQEQWESLVELMGNPEWASLDAVATQPARRENADLVGIYLGEWLATQSVDELAVQAQHARVCITPVTTMAQLDANDHLNARGFFATAPDGTRQLGPGYKLDQPWWALGSAAPALGEHDGETWQPRPDLPGARVGWRTTEREENESSEPSTRGCSGLRLHLDLGWAVRNPISGAPGCRGHQD